MPKANHKQDPAKRAIQTFKSHFASIINGVNEEFPLDACNLLTPQTNVTPNLLQTSPVNPSHSACSHIHGPHNFSVHLPASPGCQAVSREQAIKEGGTRGMWGNRGKVACCVGPKLEAHRVWNFCDPVTKRVHDNDTAEFYPDVKTPAAPTSEHPSQLPDCIKELLEALPMPHLHTDEDERLDAVLQRLRQIHVNDGTVRVPDATNTNGATSEPAAEARNSVTLPRVDPAASRINCCKPKKKQRFPLGTQVRMKEATRAFVGKASECNPHTGPCRVVFDDGEHKEFDKAEMAHLQLRPPKEGNLAQTATMERIRTLRNSTLECALHLKAMDLPHTETSRHAIEKITPHGHATAQNSPIHCGVNAGSFWDNEMGCWMACCDLINHPNPVIKERWTQAGIDEFARFAQGCGDTKGMDMVEFINKSDAPRKKKVTCAQCVVDHRPKKDEPWRLHITCGGDRLECDGNATTHGASMEVIKCQLNDIVSTPNARAAATNMSNMHLGSDLPESECAQF